MGAVPSLLVPHPHIMPSSIIQVMRHIYFTEDWLIKMVHVYPDKPGSST